MKAKWFILIAAVAVCVTIVAAVRCLIFVDETEVVIVTQFGDPIRTLDREDQKGLHFKLPYQSTIRIDRRLQIYDPPPSEFLAAEKKNVDLDVFVCWRVGKPQRFLETVNDLDGAKSRIHDIVFSELAAEVGRNPLEAMVSTESQLYRLDELVGGVAKKCAHRARSAYGIEIVDVRLKRISLPAEVRDSVFKRMRAERERMARRYRAEGNEEALKIRAEAEKQQTIILADAKAEATKLRGEAEAAAIKIDAEAYRQDPAFYELVRTLETYRKALDEKTTLFLSTDSDLLKYLTKGAMLEEPPKPE